MTGTSNNETPGPGGDWGSRPPQADAIQPDNDPQRVAVLPGDGHRRPRSGRRLRSSHVRPDAPDLGALAKEAVIGFLQDASIATAEREAVRAETAVAGTGTAAMAGTGVTNDPGEADGISAADEPLPGPAAAGACRVDAESGPGGRRQSAWPRWAGLRRPPRVSRRTSGPLSRRKLTSRPAPGRPPRPR